MNFANRIQASTEVAQVEAQQIKASDQDLEDAVNRILSRTHRGKYSLAWSDYTLVVEFRKRVAYDFTEVRFTQWKRLCETHAVYLRFFVHKGALTISLSA